MFILIVIVLVVCFIAISCALAIKSQKRVGVLVTWVEVLFFISYLGSTLLLMYYYIHRDLGEVKSLQRAFIVLYVSSIILMFVIAMLRIIKRIGNVSNSKK